MSEEHKIYTVDPSGSWIPGLGKSFGEQSFNSRSVDAIAGEATKRGFVIPVLIGVSEPRARLLASEGKRVPEAIALTALLDTGMEGMAIDHRIFEKLDLQSRGFVKLATVENVRLAMTTDVSVTFPRLEPSGRQFHLPTVQAFFISGLGQTGVGALLGREILKHFTFTYDGKTAVFALRPND